MFLDVSPSTEARPPLGFVAPLLPTLVSEPPAGHAWLHEIKHDGHRTILLVEGGAARAFTRNGHDWTKRYRRVVDCAAGLRCRSAIIDGELIVQNDQGLSDFDSLYRAITRDPHRLCFFAFDLLHLDGEDLRRRPIEERRARLQELLGSNHPDCPIQFSEAVQGDGAVVFAAADRMGLEGIVSKRLGSRYRSGRSTDWLKTKCMAVTDFIVIGTQRNEGGPPLALLARNTDGTLAYMGSAFVTLPSGARDEFWARAAELASPKPAVAGLRSPRTTWCRPELTVRARHLRGGGMLCHAALIGLV
jgi:DNA ligase D-like protein (predicted ligase)